MTSLLALGPDALADFVAERGGQRFHAKALRRNVVARGVLDYASMTDLPAALRARLGEDLPIFSGRLGAVSEARDGTRKLLLSFSRGGDAEGHLAVETVHIPPHKALDGDGSPRGATLCVSSQAGCPVGCPFCASGLLGLERNLEHHEILEQFIRGRDLGPLRRAVVMGIGEPLLNLENLERALDAVRDEMGLGARKITVSTRSASPAASGASRNAAPGSSSRSHSTPLSRKSATSSCPPWPACRSRTSSPPGITGSRRPAAR